MREGEKNSLPMPTVPAVEDWLQIETMYKQFPLGIALIEAQSNDRHILFVNTRFKERTGYSAEDLNGALNDWLEILFPFTWNTTKVISLTEHFFANVQADLYLTIRRKQGDFFTGHIQIEPIFSGNDTTEHPCFYMMMFMKERAGSSTPGRQSLPAVNEAWIESVPGACYVFNLHNQLVYHNEEANTFFSDAPSSFGYESIEAVLPMTAEDWKAFRSEISNHREIAFCTINDPFSGQYKAAEWSFFPRYDETFTLIGFFGIGQDVSRYARIHQELSRAVQSQKDSLPLNITGKKFDFTSFYYPHFYLSGDTYGYYFDQKNNKLIIYLVDIMGHGIYTAMQTSALNTLFQTSVKRQRISAEGQMKQMNEHCCLHLPDDSFAAAMIAEIDFNRLSCHIVSAGIPHLLHITNEHTERKSFAGTPLGMFEQSMFRRRSFPLTRESRLIFGTDGFFETLDTFQDANTVTCEGLYSFVQRAALAGRSQDDTSAIILKLK
ncbi:SpoIIE family protein phosphatase [Salisediminibacterium halotolerans]|uniref:SpoIIE family protein phosphatase n=1 Tax=Salisediminibacterium halotolerans TaxID=517425 RepID=UPI000EB4C314|nr:SpoIIE family protein phosphatase [Salisediminibacterium halotolerans]RLJ75426.1 sigma-B regulation protein RsbU (phosphoserine phosphatase) [Actinophytocola xinjiangensis]RPE89279.1 sigma-B regulation protein RsbU (phosphoserine phosphatase) [Salisediminibacterium halotolerans]TWG36039.1 sigma-B regulation protein RsbU (phosphoserine phosphatase) [Salisediminibacterium halotolerans]GEL07496.1 hypothetical protein SHA02_09120 [Salisediminibacterium halotolerans]